MASSTSSSVSSSSLITGSDTRTPVINATSKNFSMPTPNIGHFAKLTETNYNSWPTQMRPFLNGHGLMKYVDGSCPAPTKMLDATLGTFNPAYTAWFQADQLVIAPPLADPNWFPDTGATHYMTGNAYKMQNRAPYPCNSLVALDVLKVLEDGDIQTLGILDYDKRLSHFTAHPKVDPFTGEMFTFGYSWTPPYCTYQVISRDGFMHDQVKIPLSECVMMHDFAITESYAIFMDLPLYFRPKEMVKENKLILTFDETKKARFGILPRYAKDEHQIKWFELPNCFIFHNANAWEEGEEIVLITCRVEKPDLGMADGSVTENLDNITSELYEMRFNMETGLATQKKLSASAIDFPRVNENYTGRKQRFIYGLLLDSVSTRVIKFDLHAEPEVGKTKCEVGGNIAGIFDLGAGNFGSDAIYVSRKPGITSEEDDGYVIFFVYNENTGMSSVNVIDAKSMSAVPVAVVEIPNRVPYGFHALFMTEKQLHEQAY